MQPTSLILVPCAPGKRKSCDLLREALQQVTDGRPELQILEADSEELSSDECILALDSSPHCRASEILKSRRIKVAGALSVTELLASRRILDPGKPVESQWPQLLEGLVQALNEETDKALTLRREEAAYFKEMGPVVGRYLKETSAVEKAGPPSAELPSPSEKSQERLGLAANRFRNLFMRLDEIIPPPPLATLHDVFQDACMCMTYALQHWEREEWKKALEYLEQASHQAGPMLRHKGLASLKEKQA
ncbi:MAG: hypothetical protein GTO55_01050 [Armatimonadetes bacterium]|nr:hypothetical protein [Armatimonadota bacterium]NIM22871.1 hypothetical protein [Armatimonadota bacterium]NIM66737.1 hypothetical protein [Armatimonadota bacterium]NIM75294.1 hypothetical protein [Armatimonadota bacterium]NIN04934.1 hypothetical protein [Armatimonadota bacterium]